MMAMKVVEIWRYPVKSMAGEQVNSATLGQLGIPGDRAWALRQSGVTRNAKKYPGLMSLRAHYEQEPKAGDIPAPVITLEDGSLFAADDTTASTRLSQIVGDDVMLKPLAPIDDLDYYRRRERRTVEESRAIFGLEPDEPFPDTSGMPKRVVEFATPPGTYFDCFPLMVMTTASLNALQAVAGDSIIDVRRFRPNILIETSETGFVERDWVGKTLCIGDVRISCEIMCPRCVMTTIGFHDLPRDTKIMRTLVRECSHELGVYCEIAAGGQVRVGDTAHVSS